MILLVASSLLPIAFLTKAKAKTIAANTAPIGVAINANDALAIPNIPFAAPPKDDLSKLPAPPAS